MIYYQANFIPDEAEMFVKGRKLSFDDYDSVFWTDWTLDLKKRIEDLTNRTFHLAKLKYFPSGNEGTAWKKYHNFVDCNPFPIVAIAFLGMSRTLAFRSEDNKKEMSFRVGHGDLFVFYNEHLTSFWHRICQEPTDAETVTVVFRPRVKGEPLGEIVER